MPIKQCEKGIEFFMYNILALTASILLPLVILRKEITKGSNIKDFLQNNKIILIIYVSLVVGFSVRLMFIAEFPNGLNVDEASSAYEAYSILNYGIDRNGNFMPVFLEAWGSGQNALYTYLAIPFIKILGLNVLSTRLPMAIIGCVSLIVMYKILKQTENDKLKTIGIIFFAITPWHIMKSRWGLESNIFPDLVLYATFFIMKYLKSKQIKNMYFSAIILGLCSYAYGTSYFFLPIFMILVLGYLYIKKEIKINHVITVLLTIFVISLPIIICLIINTFGLQEIKIFFVIPVLEENRYEELSSIFGSNFINSSLANFKESLKILILQNDKLGWNEIPIYGLTYVISLPFMIIGIYKSFKEKTKENWIFNFWFITAFLLMFVVEPNVNRINIIIIPIIYYTFLGLDIVFENIQLSKLFIPIIYGSLFISFEISYFTTDWNSFLTFSGNIENMIKYVDKIDTEKIYFEYTFKEPYIYICFYNKINTKEFVNTVKYKNNQKGFDAVESFGKYNFYIPSQIDENAVYVFKSGDEKKYNFKKDKWQKEYIDNFVILKAK